MPNATVAAMMRTEPPRNAVIAFRRSRAGNPAWYIVTFSPAETSASYAAWVLLCVAA